MSAGKNLLFVTGTRADYGKLEPLALAAVAAGHDVSFFVTGMHMMERYGLTKIEVHRNSSFKVIEFINQRHGDPQDIIIAKTITGFSDVVQELKPDLVVVHGDRVEALACAMVCATNYVRCAHVEGGEVSGTIDEVLRHCNTKLSTIHLLSSEKARERVIRMGESEDRSFVIGSPELDVHRQPSGVSLDDVFSRYEISNRDYGVCVFHPVTSEVATIGQQAASIFDVLEQSGQYFVVILPNNDPGSEFIRNAIDKLPTDRFRVLPSMRFSFFSELLRNTNVVVGNSSLGVREAPFLGIPSLDVGSRQTNRAEADSVFNCRAEEQDKIRLFLEDQWGLRYDSHQGFGSGNAAENFSTILSNDEFWSLPLQKSFME